MTGDRDESPLVDGRRFVGERVVLGDRRFERCAFVRCELVLDGRPVHLVESSFEDCAWSFEGAAGRTIDALAALCRGDRGLRITLAGELGLLAREAQTTVASAALPPQRRDYH